MAGFAPVGSLPVGATPAAAGGITVSGSIASPLRLGQTYSTAFVASGGTAPYAWTASGLPTGLSIDASTGVVSGTLTAAGTFTATVTATDALSATGSTSPMTVVVNAIPGLNYDWPNPRPYLRAIDLRTWTAWTALSALVAPPDINHDFPNPRGQPWPSDVRTGWLWQTPTALYAATYNYEASSKFLGYAVLAPPLASMNAAKFLGYAVVAPPMTSVNASKFIAYAVLQPIPYNVQRVYENPLPIPPGKWSFLRRWESGPPFPLRETPYHPFGAQEFPDRLPDRPRRIFDGAPNILLAGATAPDDGFVYLIC